jgi:hypothetical protein
MMVNGLEFFYFYPREAQTILGPFDLLAILWLLTGWFSAFGLIGLGLWVDRTGSRIRHRQLLALALGATVAVASLLFVAVYYGYSIPFWWIGTIAVGLCWLSFGDGITRMIGGRRHLTWSFVASLSGIGAVVEVWSLSHWLYFAVAPSTLFGKAGADLEMNLTYAWSSLFPAIFMLAWLSPVWAFVVFKAYQWAKSRKPIVPGTAAATPARPIKFGLDDFILVIVLILLCTVIGFYPYFHDPSWLVGTDAYWRYKDPLERVASSPNALAAASGERHSLYLLILYGFLYVTRLSSFDIVKASPMVLASLLSVLTYLGVTYLRRNRTEGFFAGFLSATTFPTTLGIFGSIDANWFAMSVGFVTVCAIGSIDASSGKTLWKPLSAALCGMILLVLHPWTWGIIALSVLVAGLVFLAKRRWNLSMASVVLFLSGLMLGGFVFALGSETEKARLIESVTDFGGPLISPSLVEHPFGVIYDALRIWAPFLNPMLMVLVMIGVVLLIRERFSSYKILMLSWMVIAGIGTFLGVTLRTEIWRIWYVQPLWILGATGVKGLLEIGNSDWAGGQIRYLVAARAVVITCAAGLAVALLEPVVGSVIFYAALISIVALHIGGQGANTKTVFVTIVILFISVFFLDHALRSLYPLILNPHNYLTH